MWHHDQRQLAGRFNIHARRPGQDRRNVEPIPGFVIDRNHLADGVWGYVVTLIRDEHHLAGFPILQDKTAGRVAAIDQVE
jgi:hypothetical protein